MKIFTAFAALTLLVVPTHAQEPSPELSARIEAKMREWKIPGLGIAVTEDYRVEWAAGFGLSDMGRGLKVGEDTLYLAVLLGSKTGGHGLVLMVNVALEDMSGSVPQFEFLTKLVRRIADEERWP